MRPFHRIGVKTLVACLTAYSSAFAAAPKPPTAEEVEKIAAAAPAKARAKPARSRKLLVFSLGKGYVHTAIPYGAKALELMGKGTGAFEAVHSSDPADFKAESLARFDAVCINNSNRMTFFKDAALRKALLAYVKGGKGLVAIHAATTNFAPAYGLDWPEGAALIGGIFESHPWHEKVTIKLDDPTHALCAAFGGRGFEIKDEIYQFRGPYSRKKLRVLLSLDVGRTNMDKGNKIKRTDGDFAVSWVQSYGKGRVFYCSLGHDHDVFWNPAVLKHYLDGIQFALGDLKADTTPSATAKPAVRPAARIPLDKSQVYFRSVLGIYKQWGGAYHPAVNVRVPEANLWTKAIQDRLRGKITFEEIAYEGQALLIVPTSGAYELTIKGGHVLIDGNALGGSGTVTLRKGRHKLQINAGTHGGPHMVSTTFRLVSKETNEEIPPLNSWAAIASFLKKRMAGRPVTDVSDWDFSKETPLTVSR
jgi:type 1 glutamine amidotransferase